MSHKPVEKHFATCLNCGCDDFNACLGGCSWLLVDYKHQVGVCTKCEKHRHKFFEAWPDAEVAR